MFGFFDMADNYSDRKVDQYKKDGLFVDTCSVTDGQHDYETAIGHPDYNNGELIIVEAYDSKEDAQKGHDKWVKIMTTEPLPDKLVDCLNSGIGQLAANFIDFTYPRIITVE